MAKNSQKKKRFTFNDPSQQNSYGFIIPTEGISLARFEKNPVMLDSHWNNNHSVIGRWEDIKENKGLLSGVPVFDVDDENAAKIAGKVERDFIRGCSMGITFKRDDLKYLAGNLVLEKCELYEVSIVAVPSNANSIHLYHEDGKTLMTDEEVQELCLSAIPSNNIQPDEITPNNQENENMKVTLTSAAALAIGLAANQTEIESEELSAKITALESEKKAAELKLSAKIEAEEQANLTRITNKVKLAIKEGKFSAEKEQSLINLGIANEELLDDTLGTVNGKASLAAQVENKGTSEVKTAEDFQKLSLDAQLQFKQTQPEAYSKIFTKKQ